MEFDDVYIVARSMIEGGKIKYTPEIILELEKLNQILGDISGITKAKLWDINSLNCKEWDIVRKTAQEILNKI